MRVIGGFKCPYTGHIYRVGDEYKGDKVKEFQQKGYLEITDETPDHDEVPDFDTMTKKEIIEYAKSKGIKLDDRMNKKEMIEELV